MTEDLAKWVSALTRPKAVLVVDDDSLIRMIFKCVSESFHVETAFAPSAAEAIALLRKKKYDFIFLDMKLEMAVSGMEVLRFVNAAQPDASVVIMSGSISLHDIMHEANGLGVLSFIRKPTSFTVEYITAVFTKLGCQPNGIPPLSPADVLEEFKSL
jgi:DNA-binding NtrC family response regulator